MGNYGRAGGYTNRASDSAVARIESARAGAYAGIGETAIDRQRKSAFERLHLLGFAVARAARSADVPLNAATGILRRRNYGWVTGTFLFPSPSNEGHRYGSVLGSDGRIFEVAILDGLEAVSDEESVTLSAGRVLHKPSEFAYPRDPLRIEDHTRCLGDFIVAHNLRAIMDAKQ